MSRLIKYYYLTFLILTGFGHQVHAQIIDDMEYFIDNGDLGIGLNTKIGITLGATIAESFIVPTTALTEGFHTIYFRVHELDSNRWSMSESRSFYISPSNLTTQASIMALEYYIDTDPGYGAGTAIPVTAATNINVSTTITTTALTPGFHSLYIRALDQDGVWGEIESRSFFLDAFSNGLITDIEYFFNTDPGYGSGSKLVINPPKDSIDSVVNIPTGALAVGPHTLGIRLITDKGTFGITDYYNFALCAGATAVFVSDVVCIGGTTSFTDNSLNVLTGDVFSWDFDGDGVEDSNTAGDQSFIYPAPGVYTATLSIDRLGCIGVDTVQVSVETIPVANAGPDQSLCTTSTVLAANVLGTSETGSWTVLSGSALIAAVASPTSTLSGITTNNVDLIWTVTNTLGGCSTQDTVSIAANLPITASLLNGSVDIGKTLNIDVQSSALINPGDVLITTIMTTPLYGIANILSDGSIDYIPDLDAMSADSLMYRITNQCANFDQNQVLFNVINDPPVIDTVGISVAPGTTEVSVDLTTIISDPNGNIDFSTITIITQPISGAIATVDANGILSIDYRGITFSGTDRIEVRVCDLVGVCTIETITIPGVEVGGVNPPITVFNGVSPDGDGFNDFLEIENIEFYPQNVVIILNRWGAEIAKYQGYNNQDVKFNDATLPSGTYYYHILPGVKEVNEVTGHFVLKID